MNACMCTYIQVPNYDATSVQQSYDIDAQNNQSYAGSYEESYESNNYDESYYAEGYENGYDNSGYY